MQFFNFNFIKLKLVNIKMDPFENLIPDAIIQIALEQDVNYISKMCQLNTRFNNLICNNENFWQLKFIKDFGYPENINIVSWEEAYKNYGRVVSFGENMSGQLGLGTNNKKIDIPTLIPEIRAKYVACGKLHTVLIDINNNVWAFGFNKYGQLGLGDNINRNIPIQIPNIKAKYVACGSMHTMIIDINNNVWAFGDNYKKQLGLGDNINRDVPTLIPKIKAQSVSCGEFFTMIIDLNNNVWAFGNNYWGQLGLGDLIKSSAPMVIPKIKAQTISCGHSYTIIILNPNQQFESNVRFIPFNEVIKKLNSGEFTHFDFLPEYQTIIHKINNYIGTFYGKDNNIYLTELQYDETTNQIYPPI
jgi:hypothetical protein